jgi:tetratricopeptide (TPR) repeat protein
MTRIASTELRYDESKALCPRLRRFELGEFFLVSRAACTFQTDDERAKVRVLADLDTSDVRLVRMAVQRAGGSHPGHLAARVRLAQLLTRPHRAATERASGWLMIADVELARGRLRAADSARMHAARLVPDAVLDGMLRAFVASPSFEHRSRSEMLTAREDVAAALLTTAIDSARQRFLLGVLDARLGDYASAQRRADELEQWSRIAAAPAGVAGDPARAARARERWSARLASLAVSLRADVERRAGNPERALAILADWHPERWWTIALHDPVRAQPYERRLHAEVLEAAGRHDEAARWYAVWHGPLVSGTAYSTTARLRMARLLETRLGRSADALEAYSRVLDAWVDADPEFDAEHEDARRAVARLSRRSQ